MLVDRRIISEKFCHYLNPSYRKYGIECYFFPRHFSNKVCGDESTTLKFKTVIEDYLKSLKIKGLNKDTQLYIEVLLCSSHGQIGFPYRIMELNDIPVSFKNKI